MARQQTRYRIYSFGPMGRGHLKGCKAGASEMATPILLGMGFLVLDGDLDPVRALSPVLTLHWSVVGLVLGLNHRQVIGAWP